jgi:hypothetical protein
MFGMKNTGEFYLSKSGNKKISRKDSKLDKFNTEHDLIEEEENMRQLQAQSQAELNASQHVVSSDLQPY